MCLAHGKFLEHLVLMFLATFITNMKAYLEVSCCLLEDFLRFLKYLILNQVPMDPGPCCCGSLSSLMLDIKYSWFETPTDTHSQNANGKPGKSQRVAYKTPKKGRRSEVEMETEILYYMYRWSWAGAHKGESITELDLVCMEEIYLIQCRLVAGDMSR